MHAERPALRVAFAGTPAFAARALEAIAAAGFTVVGVLTQPDRPAGRGLQLQASEVKRLAQALGVAVAQPLSLKLDGRHAADAQAARAALTDWAPDVMVVAAYGLILPPWTLELPRLGCLNIHGSLLPRWRGAAPIHRAIEAGDTRTGVTIMQMDAGLDTGAMLRRAEVDIDPLDTTATLHDRLAALGAQEVVEALHDAQQARGIAVPQPEAGVTYAHKVDKAEAALDLREPAEALARRIRAFDPFPGATLVLDGATLKVWAAEAPAEGGASAAGRGPGEVVACGPQGLDIACGAGSVLRLLQVQRAGGRRVSVREFLAGHPLAPDARVAVLP